jgi:hypothetical protein
MTAPKPLQWTQSELRALFDYDPESGILTWKVGKRTGYAVGSVGKAGYLYVKIANVRNVRVHRVIWKWMTGEDPTLDVDHIDRVRTNNRWKNLRTLTRAQNCRNTPGTRVTLHKASGLYVTRMRYNGRTISLGYYRTETEAQAAYTGVVKFLRVIHPD